MEMVVDTACFKAVFMKVSLLFGGILEMVVDTACFKAVFMKVSLLFGGILEMVVDTACFKAVFIMKVGVDWGGDLYDQCLGSASF